MAWLGEAVVHKKHVNYRYVRPPPPNFIFPNPFTFQDCVL
jgi:hypothetical protein